MPLSDTGDECYLAGMTFDYSSVENVELSEQLHAVHVQYMYCTLYIHIGWNTILYYFSSPLLPHPLISPHPHPIISPLTPSSLSSPVDDVRTLPPCPLLLILSTEGVLMPFTVVNEKATDDELKDMVRPPQPLPAVQGTVVTTPTTQATPIPLSNASSTGSLGFSVGAIQQGMSLKTSQAGLTSIGDPRPQMGTVNQVGSGQPRPLTTPSNNPLPIPQFNLGTPSRPALLAGTHSFPGHTPSPATPPSNIRPAGVASILGTHPLGASPLATVSTTAIRGSTPQSVALGIPPPLSSVRPPPPFSSTWAPATGTPPISAPPTGVPPSSTHQLAPVSINPIRPPPVRMTSTPLPTQPLSHYPSPPVSSVLTGRQMSQPVNPNPSIQQSHPPPSAPPPNVSAGHAHKVPTSVPLVRQNTEVQLIYLIIVREYLLVLFKIYL